MTQRKRRTCVGVVVLGIGALALDRLVLRPDAVPADARAGVVAAPSAVAGVGQSPSGSLTIPELPFPRELPPLSDSRPFRDLFARVSAEQSALNGATENVSTAVERERSSDSAAFVTQHRLEAVMNHGGLKIAVVNGVWLRVGQSIGECKLTRIDGTQARFDCRNDEAVLDLRDSSGFLGSGR